MAPFRKNAPTLILSIYIPSVASFYVNFDINVSTNPRLIFLIEKINVRLLEVIYVSWESPAAIVCPGGILPFMNLLQKLFHSLNTVYSPLYLLVTDERLDEQRIY